MPAVPCGEEVTYRRTNCMRPTCVSDYHPPCRAAGGEPPRPRRRTNLSLGHPPATAPVFFTRIVTTFVFLTKKPAAGTRDSRQDGRLFRRDLVRPLSPHPLRPLDRPHSSPARPPPDERPPGPGERVLRRVDVPLERLRERAELPHSRRE